MTNAEEAILDDWEGEGSLPLRELFGRFDEDTKFRLKTFRRYLRRDPASVNKFDYCFLYQGFLEMPSGRARDESIAPFLNGGERQAFEVTADPAAPVDNSQVMNWFDSAIEDLAPAYRGGDFRGWRARNRPAASPAASGDRPGGNKRDKGKERAEPKTADALMSMPVTVQIVGIGPFTYRSAERYLRACDELGLGAVLPTMSEFVMLDEGLPGFDPIRVGDHVTWEMQPPRDKHLVTVRIDAGKLSARNEQVLRALRPARGGQPTVCRYFSAGAGRYVFYPDAASLPADLRLLLLAVDGSDLSLPTDDHDIGYVVQEFHRGPRKNVFYVQSPRRGDQYAGVRKAIKGWFSGYSVRRNSGAGSTGFYTVDGTRSVPARDERPAVKPKPQPVKPAARVDQQARVLQAADFLGEQGTSPLAELSQVATLVLPAGVVLWDSTGRWPSPEDLQAAVAEFNASLKDRHGDQPEQAWTVLKMLLDNIRNAAEPEPWPHRDEFLEALRIVTQQARAGAGDNGSAGTGPFVPRSWVLSIDIGEKPYKAAFATDEEFASAATENGLGPLLAANAVYEHFQEILVRPTAVSAKENPADAVQKLSVYMSGGDLVNVALVARTPNTNDAANLAVLNNIKADGPPCHALGHSGYVLLSSTMQFAEHDPLAFAMLRTVLSDSGSRDMDTRLGTIRRVGARWPKKDHFEVALGVGAKEEDWNYVDQLIGTLGREARFVTAAGRRPGLRNGSGR